MNQAPTKKQQDVGLMNQAPTKKQQDAGLMNQAPTNSFSFSASRA